MAKQLTPQVARRTFKYGSRQYLTGDTVPVRPSDRRPLRAMGWIGDAPKVAPRIVEPVVIEDEPVEKPKRKYTRRDLQAEG